MELAVIRLKDKCDRRIRGGHLWVYSNEIDNQATPLKKFSAGQQAVLESANGKVVGVVYLNPNSLICGRLITRDLKDFLGVDLLARRIRQALVVREKLYADSCYRLIYGESDALPGLVVDRFKDVLVVQIGTVGMEQVKEDIVAALVAELAPVAIVLKNDSLARRAEDLSEYVDVVYGELPPQVMLTENGARFEVPVLDGQKTGWFYDHRENRERLKRYCQGARVLDVFSYGGSWGVQAAIAGASEVVCVDSSPLALEYVAKNALHNDVADTVITMKGQANSCMRELIDGGEKFDVVIVDPPAFIKKRKDIKVGEAGYKQLNQLAMRLLNDNGILVSASCSMHLEKSRLNDILRAASRQVEKRCQILEQGGQGPDHPVHPAIVETEYLKAVFARIYS
jgi:23S rRNA (cytosine1962-C5)-methyltransferase